MPNLGSVLLVLVLLTVFPGLAAPFNGINAALISTIPYQGGLADASGSPVMGKQNMEFRLYSVPNDGAPLWEEFWTGANSVDVSDGLFSVMLGSINTGLTAVVQGNNNLYLGITVGTDSEMEPRVQLGSVPFSIWSLTVADNSITSAKVANGAIGTDHTADGAVKPEDIALDAWGIIARTQGLIVMPEGGITDDWAGNIVIENSLIVMNPMTGSFVRVAGGTYHIDPWDYLYIELPPSVLSNATVTPQVGDWGGGSTLGTNRFLIAQRMASGRVWFNFGWLP